MEKRINVTHKIPVTDLFGVKNGVLTELKTKLHPNTVKKPYYKNKLFNLYLVK